MNHKKGGLENRRGGVGGGGGGGSRGGGETLEQRRRVIDPEKGSNEQLDGRAGPVQRAARPVLQHQGVDPKFLRFLRHSTAPTRPLPPLFLAY